MTPGSPTVSTLPTSPPQKWSSGPELNAESPVVLTFPPPPPSLSQQPKDSGGSGLGGSSTNIRMGTRAIRMSRERDLSGQHDVSLYNNIYRKSYDVLMMSLDTRRTKTKFDALI